MADASSPDAPEADPAESSGSGLGALSARQWLWAAVPVVLLAVLVGLVIAFPPFGGVGSGAPLPEVSISHVTLPSDEKIVLHVTNSGAESVTVSQVLINDAYWSFEMLRNGELVSTLRPAQSARIVVPYHWTPGWDVGVGLVLEGGATVHHTIVAPQPTPGLTAGVLWTLALIGLLVGVIPVALGMLWFTTMERLPDRSIHAILAFSAGILAFLVFDGGFEAFEVAHTVPGVYEGPLLVVLGIVGAIAAVQLAMDRFGGEGRAPLVLAYGIAVGIGLHNLAEGLAIGSAFALGRVSLGAFLVIGFMIHNVTEGPAIVAPVARGERPALHHFAAMGLIGGAPAIVGGWIGSAAYGPTLGAFFLAIGVGALLQVIVDIADLVSESGRLLAAANVGGFTIGFAVMYVTDLLVVI